MQINLTGDDAFRLQLLLISHPVEKRKSGGGLIWLTEFLLKFPRPRPEMVTRAKALLRLPGPGQGPVGLLIMARLTAVL